MVASISLHFSIDVVRCTIFGYIQGSCPCQIQPLDNQLFAVPQSQGGEYLAVTMIKRWDVKKRKHAPFTTMLGKTRRGLKRSWNGTSRPGILMGIVTVERKVKVPTVIELSTLSQTA